MQAYILKTVTYTVCAGVIWVSLWFNLLTSTEEVVRSWNLDNNNKLSSEKYVHKLFAGTYAIEEKGGNLCWFGSRCVRWLDAATSVLFARLRIPSRNGQAADVCGHWALNPRARRWGNLVSTVCSAFSSCFSFHPGCYKSSQKAPRIKKHL